MSEIEDYTNANRVISPEEWLKGSGVYKGGIVTEAELLRILKAYKGYIYEAEMRPQVTFNGEEIQIGQDEDI